MRFKKIVQSVKKATKKAIDTVVPKPTISRDNGLSSGSTLLNLALTDNPFVAYVKGYYYLLAGDSSSGKTILVLTTLAEAANNKNFANYRFIYDDVENGNLFNMPKLFGQAMVNRIEPPAVDKDGTAKHSSTVEDFFYHVDDAAKHPSKKPFIYILDSMDALTSEAADEKFDEQKKAHRAGKESTGSYGDGKAKKNSENLRRMMKTLRRTGSILIVICQLRDNIGFGFKPKKRSGGNVLTYLATWEVWAYLAGKIKKTVKKKERTIGTIAKLAIEKNRFTGSASTFEVPIYRSYGLDDLGSCIDYLVKEEYWKKTDKAIHAPEFEITGTKDEILKKIEDTGGESLLRKTTGVCWKEIQDACALQRKPRY